MNRTKLAYIHKDIHDWRRPVIVPPHYIRQLRKMGEITAKEKKAALQGEEINVLGYRLLADKKLPKKCNQPIKE